MISSRNIHFAILGIILGATTGYVLAFYQVQSSTPREAASQQQQGSNLPGGHPNVNNDQLLAMFKDALAKNPNDTTLMARYGSFLFELGKSNEAIEWFQKVVALQPRNLDVRADLVIVHLEKRDFTAAEQVLKQMEAIDPKYEGLEPLRKRLTELRGK